MNLRGIKTSLAIVSEKEMKDIEYVPELANIFPITLITTWKLIQVKCKWKNFNKIALTVAVFKYVYICAYRYIHIHINRYMSICVYV